MESVDIGTLFCVISTLSISIKSRQLFSDAHR